MTQSVLGLDITSDAARVLKGYLSFSELRWLIKVGYLRT